MARAIKIELDLDSTGFTAKITQAGGAVRTFNTAVDSSQRHINKMDRNMRGLLATTRDLTLILSQVRTAIYNMRVVFTGWAEAIVQTNIRMERMTYLLANLSDAATATERFREAAENMDFLFETAKSAPFSVNALTDSFVKMKSVGIDPTEGSLGALTNAVAAFGGTDDVLKRASIAIQQMGGKGVISMEELRQQLGEAVPNAVRLLARSMNLTYGQLVDRISKGQVEASSALEKMFGEFDRTFGGSAQALMDSFGGKLAVLQTTLIDFATSVGGLGDNGFAEGSFMAVLGEQLDRLIEIANSPEMQAFGVQLGQGLVTFVNVVVGVIQKMYEWRDVIITAGKAFALYFGGRAIIGTLQTLGLGVLTLVGRFGGLSAALVNVQRGLFTTRIAIGSFIAGTAGASTAAAGLGVGLTAMGRGFTAMLGPIGLALIALYTIADAMGLFKDKTKEANDAIELLNKGIVTNASIDDIVKGMQELRAEVENIESLGRAGTSGDRRKRFDEIFDQFKVERNLKVGDFAGYRKAQEDAIAQLVSEIEGEYEAAAKALNEASNLLFENQADNFFGGVERSINKSKGAIAAAYRQAANDLDAELLAISQDQTLSAEERAKKEDEVKQKKLANIQAANAKELALLQEYRDELQYGIDVITETGDISSYNGEFGAALARQFILPREAVEALTRAQEDLDDKIATTNERAAAQAAIFSADNVYVAGTTNNDDDESKLASLEKHAKSLQARAAGMQAEFDGAGKALGRLNAEIALGMYDETAADFDTWKQAAIDAATKIDDLNEAIKQQKKDASIEDRLSGEYEKAKQNAESMMMVLTGGYTEIEGEAAIYEQRLRAIAGAHSNITEEMEKNIVGAVEAFKKAQGADYANQLRLQTRDILASLGTVDEQRQANYEADIARADEIWRLNQANGTLTIEIERQIAAYKDARRQQFEFDSMSSFERMLVSWQETSNAMSDAASQWMDSFVNDLVRGEFNFGKFATAILEDIAKIIIRAQIAAAIMAVIGSLGGGAGAGDVQGPLTGGLEGTIYHSGGVVGETIGGKMSLPASVFAGAKRYHTGGMVGLADDERPAVLQVGERVLTKEEQRALNRGNTGAGANVQVNIVNESGQALDEESRSSSFDGEKYVIDIVVGAAGRPGAMRSAIAEASRG